MEGDVIGMMWEFICYHSVMEGDVTGVMWEFICYDSVMEADVTRRDVGVHLL